MNYGESHVKKTIQLGPSLVVLIGPSGAGKSHFCEEHFEAREVVSTDAIRLEFTGDLRRQDKNDAVFKEFHHRIEVKLAVGQRVVADATNLRNRDRRDVAEVGKMMNVPVTYVVINRSMESKFQTGGWRNDVFSKGRPLMEKMEETFRANEKVILAGDGLADLVIDTRVDEFEVVQPIQRTHVLRQLLDRGFEYVRVFGDVHGNTSGLLQATQGVDDRGVTFLLSLGDVIDYGSNTLKAAAWMYELVSRGEAIMIRGNHERKIANWITQERQKKGSFRGRLSHGNDVTTNQLLAMDTSKRVYYENAILRLVDLSPDWIMIGNMMFTHGAVHHRMWGNTLFRPNQNSALESYSLFGETTGQTDPTTGFPIRKYDWVHEIEAGHEAVVGHAILDREAPVVLRGRKGGNAVFLDTGSGKEGGKLSWMDYEIVERRGRSPRLEFMKAQDEHGNVLDDLLVYKPAP